MAIPLIVPGLHGSGDAHWQTWLQAQLPEARRVEQGDWARPDLLRWSINVSNAITRIDQPVILIAHSFGALAAVLAGTNRFDRVRAALLVAPADPVHFADQHLLPTSALPFPSLLVASSNDPWLGLDAARTLASTWRSRFFCLGRCGHINTESGFGPWPAALTLLNVLMRISQTEVPDVSGRLRGVSVPLSALSPA